MGASAPRRLSDADASVDKVHKPGGFIKVSINAAYFQLSAATFGLVGREV
jgi:hypothetical protein